MIKSIKKELEIEESLKQGDKDKIINFIEKVDKTNNEYQNIQELSITLTNIDEKIKDIKDKDDNAIERNSRKKR